MDTSEGLAMDAMMRDDPHMYMSPEMMSLFHEGGVDVQHLFSSEFLQSQTQAQQQQQVHHSNGDRPGNGRANTPSSACFASPTFIKMNGLPTSP
jgi:hypothetical protein